MKQKPIYETAQIDKDNYCGDCGWPLIHACCNDEFQDHKDAGDWDWWIYCSNKGCKNHDGVGTHYAYPEWAKSVDKN